MAEKRTGAKRPPADTKARQRARKPAVPPQRAATPTRGAGPRASRKPGQARQNPPIPADLIEHFGGQDQVDLIVAECVPEDASPGDVLRLLLEARRLGADPLRHGVYLARERARDGGDYGFSVAAKRDTLLAYAERQPDFRGFDCDAVYVGDVFKRVAPIGDGSTLRERAGVVHTREQEPPTDGAEIQAKLVRAWCAVERENRPPLVFEALAAEYQPGDEWDTLDPDDPRKRYPNRHLVKVAMCWPLRMLFGLNDVVGAEELSRRSDPLPQIGTPPARAAGALEDPKDPLDARIAGHFATARAIDPLLWPPAKVQTRLASARAEADKPGAEKTAYDDRRGELADEMAADIEAALIRGWTPQQVGKRLAELRAFGTDSLDDDTLREYKVSLAAVEARAAELGLPA